MNIRNKKTGTVHTLREQFKYSLDAVCGLFLHKWAIEKTTDPATCLTCIRLEKKEGLK